MSVVSSVFGRLGPHVVAEPGDYSSAKIINDSAVPGSTVADANDALAGQVLTRALIGADLAGTPAAPVVAKIQGRAVQDVTPNEGDRLVWSSGNNRWEPRAPGVNPYGTLYEVDFTTLATKSVAAPGSYTIDGLTWWLKGLQVATGGGNASGLLVNGSGLGIQTNFSVAYTAPGANPNNYLRWFLPLGQLPGYNATAPVCLQFRLYNDTPGRSLGAGLCNRPSNADGAISEERLHTTLIGMSGDRPSSTFRGYGMTADYSDNFSGVTLFSGTDPHDPSDTQLSVLLVSPGLAYVTAQLWTGAYHDIWSSPIRDINNVHAKAISTQPDNLGFEMVVMDQSGGSLNNYWCRGLKISQAKAA